MIKALIKNRLTALIGMFAGIGRKKRSKGMIIGIGFLMIYCLFAFCMMFGMFFSQIYNPFHQIGIDWLYFSFAVMISFCFMFIGSIFMTQSQIYEAKDNELLLSMPIPPDYILLSRMAMLLIFNYILELTVVLPAGIVYFSKAPFNAAGLIFFVLIFLLLPFLALALSSFFGWIMALITSRLRNKAIFSAALSVIFLLAYLYFYSKVSTYINMLAANGNAVAGKIKTFVFPIYWMGKALADIDLLSLLYSLLVIIIPFLLVYIILSKTFISIATTKRGAAKIVYKETEMKEASASSALLANERRRLINCPGYMINAGLGLIMMLVGAVMIIIKRDALSPVIAQVGDFVGPAMVAALCLLSSTVMFTASSLSLEGKNLWIPKSLPVPPSAILMSKVRLHVMLTLPPLIVSAAIISIVLKLSAMTTLFMILTPAVFTVFCALAGMVINIKLPKFDWISEVQVVKQSASVLVTMFGSFAAILVPGGLYLLWLDDLIPALAYIGIFTGVTALACLLMYKWIGSKGSRLFEEM